MYCLTGSNEYVTQSGSIEFNENAKIQCIPILIFGYNDTEMRFTFSLSPVTAISGLILNPAQAFIYVLPTESKC